MSQSHSRLRFDGAALAGNWRALAAMSGPHTRCGAAVKADAYGIGANDVVPRLIAAGCADFYVANWQEAAAIAPLTSSCSVTVLNGVLDGDMDTAVASGAKPMINSLAQAKRWASTGKPCDIMINSGMNRLGINPADVGAFDWSTLDIDVLSSHLASADEDVEQNSAQLASFRTVFGQIPHRRKSLANSAAIALGADYHFDLMRPGLAIYGGIPRPELADRIGPVGRIEAQVLQIRSIGAGEPVGYNATFRAQSTMRVALAAVGYADGYLRGFSNRGCFYDQDRELPVLGRVSMDLLALDVTNAAGVTEGSWINCPLDLPLLAAQSGLSQYELITGLGTRFDRIWESKV